MNLLEIVREDVEGLPAGPHVEGLRSVIRHVSAAEAHLTRGRDQKDDSAFTDAIYRSNQAFEGSIKEAYRILADKDPSRASIFTIENYLQRNRIFRDRVLAQFKNYRTEWRNPSTHDYNLDFDEDEALLAIVSVSAFAKLLVDQISERLAFNAVKDDIAENPLPEIRVPSSNLVDRVTSLLLAFGQTYARSSQNVSFETEAQIVGALVAFMSSSDRHLELRVEHAISASGRKLRVDLLVQLGQAKVVVEIKRSALTTIQESHISQILSYVAAAGAVGGVLFYVGRREEEYAVNRYRSAELPDNIAVIAPTNRAHS